MLKVKILSNQNLYLRKKNSIFILCTYTVAILKRKPEDKGEHIHTHGYRQV